MNAEPASTSATAPRPSLRRQLTFVFCGLALLIAAAQALLVYGAGYSAEETLIDRIVAEQLTMSMAAFKRDPSQAQPNTPDMRLYVADEGGNQIYRYNIGRHDQATPWFKPTTQVNLANLSTMRIDGDIWLLYQDGKVVRYHDGEQLPYSLDSSVALPAQAVDLWVGQDGDDALYLVDPPLERILVFNKTSGAYLEQFQAVEGAALRDLQGLFVDQSHNTQYILTRDNLFQERLPR